uniref:Geranylgeranyl transferase type-2 subunit alpha n=1 Tax=Caligus rogercresseyi TaxID=217165 RepID=C1BPP1_CALRO|nr:Geranylgeranyl transferase type-2 subunit alpha [Caligus rogercresseyi]
MHGRLKVKTTAQQEAERKAERASKMKSYEAAMSRLTGLRKKDDRSKEEMDEAFRLSSGLLLSNPDLTSLWNFRKEIYCGMKDEEREKSKVIRTECDLSMRCLEAQPKPYCTWHHRLWILSEYNSDPSRWDSELSLCNKYLSLDERNFHCWDYRRFVLSKRQKSDSSSEELDFSMDKIKANFSNYSAWHYRSKLLLAHGEGIASNEELRREELILTQHAAFTDPEDSSPRFYHKWLLQSSSSCHLTWRFLPEQGILILPLELKDFEATYEDKPVIKTPYHRHVIWKLNHPKEAPAPTFIFPPESNIPKANGSSNLGPDMKETLQEELQNSLELLDLEPDSKWTLSSILDIMITLDLGGHYEDILKFFQRLIELDPFREGLYKDMRSKIQIQHVISSWTKSPSKGINLSNLSLTRIDYPQYLFGLKDINLSNNDLRSLTGLHGCLSHCQSLDLSGNPMLKAGEVSRLLKTMESLKDLKLDSSKDYNASLPKDFPHVDLTFV